MTASRRSDDRRRRPAPATLLVCAPPLMCAFWAAACGGDSRSPTAPAPAGAGTVTGVVVSVVEGEPIAGANVRIARQSAIADASGRFQVTGVPEIGLFPFIIEAPGYFQRQTSVVLRSINLDPDVTVDLIPKSAPFNYRFFLQFARDELTQGQTGLRPLRPWTVAPSFYVKTALDPTGEILPPDIIEHIVTILVNGVREYSGGRLSAAAVEKGTDDRSSAAGWVNVGFRRELSQPGYAGEATVGGNQGTMWLRFDPDDPRRHVDDPSGCAARVVQVAAHEIQHTMGYYHTSGAYVSLFADPDCDAANLSESLRYHAGVMYSRPRGNMDPDTDPGDFMFGITSGADQPVVFCSDAHVDGGGVLP
jgi:hypothetical protein